MRIPRAFTDQRLTIGECIELPESVHNHCVRVLRLQLGDRLYLFNGDGLDVLAELSLVDKRKSEAKLCSTLDRKNESSLDLHIGQSISKGERMDWAIQKSVELGVKRVTPLFSERSEVRLNAERQAKRTRHWRQIAISACEQSYRSELPMIDEPLRLKDWISSVSAEVKLVLHPGADPIHLSALNQPKTIALLIGPEGGFEQNEIELAVEHGFRPWLIGPRILRTETAPVAATSILNFLWGDLNSPSKLGVNE